MRAHLALTLVFGWAASAAAEIEGALALREADQHTIEVIGWSPDESHFAIRHFTIVSSEYSEELSGGDAEPCPGYRDKSGAPFFGSLEILIFGSGKLVSRHLIQGGDDALRGECTPHDVAKARLHAAKAELSKLAIDQKATGRELAGGASVLAATAKRPQVSIELKDWLNEKADEDGNTVTATGTLALWQKGAKDAALRRKVRAEYSRMMAGTWAIEKGPLFVSPSETRVAVFAREVWGSMRGGSTTPYFVGSVRYGATGFASE